MNDDELELDLFSYHRSVKPEPESIPAAPVVSSPESDRLRPQDLQQLALGFLCSLEPDAVAAQVPARFRKYQVAAAGFWRGGGRGREVVRTAVVVVHDSLEHCFAECADREARLGAIRELRADKERLEAEIRIREPELGASDDLFAEYRSWNYAQSRDPEYRELCRQLEKLQHSLCQGSRLEHIRRTGVADLCYLAVPAGLVAPDEIAAGWGLVYLAPGRTFELIREAEPQMTVTAGGRSVLAQNIAVAASRAVCFAAGVDRTPSGGVFFRRPPRRRGRLPGGGKIVK